MNTEPTLRDRIAEALLDHLSRTADIRPGRSGDLAFMPEVTDEERLRIADAVLAVLPVPSAPTGDPTPLALAQHVTHAIHARTPDPTRSDDYRIGWEEALDAAIDAARGVLAGLLAAYDTTMRAAVLGEAADELGRMDYDTDSNDYGYDTYRDAWNGGVMDGADELRRLAAGAQQPTERCVHCTHPKRDHDGRADHREKFSPLVAGQPWCHACNAACDYAGAQQQPTTETPTPETSRASVLLEIATTLDQLAATDVIRKRRSLATARRLLAVELRRMADETRQDRERQR